jgi:hypothetical protein
MRITKPSYIFTGTHSKRKPYRKTMMRSGDINNVAIISLKQLLRSDVVTVLCSLEND